LVNADAKHLLLTGPPGCGKTTAILRLVERVRDLRLRGFYTEEVRERGQRVGFDAVGLSGRRVVIAHARSASRLRVGRYGVDPAALDELLRVELLGRDGDADAVVIDEIGKMELLCPAFVELVPPLLDADAPVVATVALSGPGLIAQVKRRDDVHLVEVSPGARDRLPEELERWLRGRVAAH
jgi:nucleoside-triphosphatase